MLLEGKLDHVGLLIVKGPFLYILNLYSLTLPESQELQDPQNIFRNLGF